MERNTNRITWPVRLAIPLALSIPCFAWASNYTVSTLDDVGPGSLRDAISKANNHSGADTISFSVSGAILLESELPALHDATGGATILGAGDVTLDGRFLVGKENGLRIQSAGNVVDGLTIVNFPGSGVHVDGKDASGNVIRACYIGTDGAAIQGNDAYGICVEGPGNTVGGTGDGDGNVIGGNGLAGIFVSGPAASGNHIQGNFIGTNPAGAVDLGNELFGVLLGSHAVDTVVGGPQTGAANVIAFNMGTGIRVESRPAYGNTFARNAIGANGGSGIELPEGANGGVAPPVLESAQPLRGKAAPNTAVDIFVDDEDEGEVFIASVTAGADGNFQSAVDVAPYQGLNVTATATDTSGNTSAFSVPVPANPDTNTDDGQGDGTESEDGEEPVDEPTGDPVDDPIDEPLDDPSDDPVDEPAGDPSDDPVDDPMDEPSGDGDDDTQPFLPTIIHPGTPEPRNPDGDPNDQEGVGDEESGGSEPVEMREFDRRLCDAAGRFPVQVLRFRTDFALDDTDLDNDGISDDALLSLLAATACIGGDPVLVNATQTAYEINLLWLDAEGRREFLEPYGELLAAWMSSSKSMKNAVLNFMASEGVPLDGAYESIACTADACMPRAVAGMPLDQGYEVFDDPSSAAVSPYMYDGDLDLDGTPNGAEMANVMANGGSMADFALSALDPELDGKQQIPEGANPLEEVSGIVDEAAVSCSGAASVTWGQLRGDFLFMGLLGAVLFGWRRKRRNV